MHAQFIKMNMTRLRNFSLRLYVSTVYKAKMTIYRMIDHQSKINNLNVDAETGCRLSSHTWEYKKQVAFYSRPNT